MAENLDDAAAVVANGDKTCGICLEEWKNPLNLPCGHSFCDGCLDGWRSRYGVKEEMRRKCPICRASIPPSREMVASLCFFLTRKQKLAEKNDTSSAHYHSTCKLLKDAEEDVGGDWDGVTVLEDNDVKPSMTMPGFIYDALHNGETKSVLRWINANRTEDRVNAIATAELMHCSTLIMATMFVAAGSSRLTFMTLLLQLGADIDHRNSRGYTAIGVLFSRGGLASGDVSERARLLLSWGASFFPDRGCSREACIYDARRYGQHELANLLKFKLGGRRCEIVNLSSRPELNGETCVVDEYLPDSNQYKVTLETKSKEVLVLGPDNLKRRDRTPQDCGYYIEFKNRTIRHDFDSSEDCQAFVAALNNDGETQPAVTEEAETRAEQAAAELLAELGLDDSPIESSSGCKTKKSKKKKGGKKKKK